MRRTYKSLKINQLFKNGAKAGTGYNSFKNSAKNGRGPKEARKNKNLRIKKMNIYILTKL